MTIQRVSQRLKGEGNLSTRMSSAARYTPYTTSHFMSYRRKALQANTGENY
ncbi:hypothetical protein DPMN_082351 [Dreissena polymorpha]|uniref:Uncharacterized protein n=1 Tax=Dreissena polymorpha TaxID=45954 RepID=A0A9D3YAT8_DREPO|nr:hypothetical protein DPMN_082351 [Dreissena polymorpha]